MEGGGEEDGDGRREKVKGDGRTEEEAGERCKGGCCQRRRGEERKDRDRKEGGMRE